MYNFLFSFSARQMFINWCKTHLKTQTKRRNILNIFILQKKETLYKSTPSWHAQSTLKDRYEEKYSALFYNCRLLLPKRVQYSGKQNPPKTKQNLGQNNQPW